MARWLGVFESAAKLVGTLTVLLAALSFVWPWLGTVVNIATAWRFGALGHVYYEIGTNQAPTADGRLFLLRPGDASFAALAAGDKLQAIDDVNFREHGRRDSRAIFRLRSGDCILVLEKVEEQKNLQNAQSGGWLKVATTACGLFR
jgi:hypothetical protein